MTGKVAAAIQASRVRGALTPLVGRDEELIMICGQILDPAAHILTLTGPGGAGKSRLAMAAAGQVQDRFAGGTVLVDLSEVESPDVAAVLARALGPAGQPARASAPAPYLLLVLDNCDRVVAALAPVLHELLTAGRWLRILATSRQPLLVYGERLIRVAPLAAPGAPTGLDLMELTEIPSVALFTQRARAVDPSFALTVDNVPAVAEICARLDGLPLAIEVFTGRMRVFPMDALLVRLRRGDDVLVGGHAEAPPRHRSIEALVAWSYDRLDLELRTVLNRLAVCVDGFGACTAADLCDLPPDRAEQLLETLVDRSLLLVREERDGEPRFAMLTTIRHFCLARLAAAGELAATRERHAGHVRRLARAAAPLLTGSGPNPGHGQAARLEQLAADAGNLGAALGYLAERGDARELAELALDAHRFWLIAGRLDEGIGWLDAAAEACAERDPALSARAADAAGTLAAARGTAQPAIERYERALAGYRALGDSPGEAACRVRLGAARCLGNGDVRRRAMAELAEVRGRDDLSEAEAALALAAALTDGDGPARERLASTALEIYRARNDRYGAALALRHLAVAAQLRSPQEADHLHRQSLRELRAVRAAPELARGLVGYARFILGAVPGQEQRVVRLLVAAERLRLASGLVLSAPETAELELAMQDLRGRLGPQRFDTACREGRRLDVDAATVEALSCPPLEQTRAADVSGSRSLTPRQFQVAVLVGQGMTNRQVAHRLDLSEWTVVNHVRQIMRKLGCTSRVQVAQWVAQQRP